MKRLAAVLVFCVSLAACSTYSVDRYAVSMDSQEELRNVSADAPNAKVAVAPFSAIKPGQTELSCRAVGPIKTPDGESFENYIRKALVDQLRFAGLFSEQSTTVIQGQVDKIDFDSMERMWYIVLRIMSNTGGEFVIVEDYDYKSSYYGETACNQTAQALMPAVQNAISKVVAHPQFRAMLAGKQAASS